MTDFNQFQLYCALQSSKDVLKDECTLTKNHLSSLTEYSDIKDFVKTHFEKIKKAGDTEVKQFKSTDKRILCKMLEDETILFLIQSTNATEPEWTHLVLKN